MIPVPIDDVGVGSGIGSIPYTPYTNGSGTVSPTTGGNIPVTQGGIMSILRIGKPNIDPSPTDPPLFPTTGISINQVDPVGLGPTPGGYNQPVIQDVATQSGTNGNIILPPYSPPTNTLGSSSSVDPNSVHDGASALSSIIGALSGLLSGGNSSGAGSGALMATQVPVTTNASGSNPVSKKLIILLILGAAGFFAYKKGLFNGIA